MRWIDDRSRPLMVAGERVEVRIPFEGESELFYAKANTFSLNPPRAVIEKNEVVLRYDTPADQPRDIRALVEQTLNEIEQHLGWQRPMINAHNQNLPAAAGQSIHQRRERLLAQSQRAEELGIPIRRRAEDLRAPDDQAQGSPDPAACDNCAVQAGSGARHSVVRAHSKSGSGHSARDGAQPRYLQGHERGSPAAALPCAAQRPV